jgi:dTDP-4-dehydrorhamnose reductase
MKTGGAMRMLVTGVAGQVALALAERGSAQGISVSTIGRPLLDLADSDSVVAALGPIETDIIVNAAAYTAVDMAETDAKFAYAVNEIGAGAVAAAARSKGVPIIHLSTDYVFDGQSNTPYREDDPVGPLGIYGRSKLAGEYAVADAQPDHAILRTAWVFSPFGKNFVRTMLRLAEERDEVAVVADQHGSPTGAHDIADGILAVARNLLARSDDPRLRGVFHMTGTGHTTWADFARFVFQISAEAGGPRARVRSITTAEYPTPAIRPANSCLDCSKLAASHAVTLPLWQMAASQCVERLLRERLEETVQ